MNLNDPRYLYEQEQLKMAEKPFKVEHTINLDWFECILSGVLIEGEDAKESYEFDGGNIVLAKMEGGTNIFKHRYEVYFGKKLFGKFNICPHNPAILKSDSIQFQLCNNVFYEEKGFADMKYFFRKLSWKMKNISRMDIALDGVNVLHIIKKCVAGDLEKLGKAKCNIHTTGKFITEGYDIGSKASNKWFTAYNKSKELEKSNKGYIKEFWERTGLPITEKMERLELKLRNEEIKKIVDFNWEDLDNFEYLASIFRTSTKDFFEFFPVDKINYDKNTTRRQEKGKENLIDVVNWDFIGGELLERFTTKETTEVYRMKQAAKTAYWCYLASARQYYSDIAQEIAINVNCLDWYVNKLEEWRRQYIKKCGHNKDGLISFQYLIKFETLEMNKQLALFEVIEKEKI